MKDGFVSDAADLVNDIYTLAVNDTAADAVLKSDTIITMYSRFGRKPDIIAKQLALNVADVRAIIGTLTLSEPVPSNRELALSASI